MTFLMSSLPQCSKAGDSPLELLETDPQTLFFNLGVNSEQLSHESPSNLEWSSGLRLARHAQLHPSGDPLLIQYRQAYGIISDFGPVLQ